MIRTSRKDRKSNIWIRQQSGLQDIIAKIKDLKWQWAGHIARMNDNRWTKCVTEWIPLDGQRKRVKPRTRWDDEIIKSISVNWISKAQNRKLWRRYGEAFIQQWI